MSLEHSTVSFVQSVIQQSMDCYLLLTTTGALSHSFGLWSIYALLFIYLMIIFALVRIFDFYWGGIERLCNFSASKPVPAGTGTNRFSQYIFSLWLRYNRFLQIWIRWNHKVGFNENWWPKVVSIKLYFFRNYRPDARSICHMGVNECFPDYDIFKVYQWKNITFPQQVGGAREFILPKFRILAHYHVNVLDKWQQLQIPNRQKSQNFKSSSYNRCSYRRALRREYRFWMYSTSLLSQSF